MGGRGVTADVAQARVVRAGDIATRFDDEYSSWVATLTDAERRALEHYIATEGQGINSALDAGDLSQNMQEIVDALDSSLNRAETPMTVRIYKGIPAAQQDIATVTGAQRIVNQAFGAGYVDGSLDLRTTGGAVVQITIRGGDNAAWLDGVAGSGYNVLVPRDRTLRVQSVGFIDVPTDGGTERLPLIRTEV